jgi:hypothetical protein
VPPHASGIRAGQMDFIEHHATSSSRQCRQDPT